MDRSLTEQIVREWASENRHPTELTLYLLNIPPSCSKNEMMSWIDDNGFPNTYDFFYLPRCFVTRKAKGYAFINLSTAAAAKRFQQTMRGALVAKNYPLSVMISTTQGLETNLVRWIRARSRRVRDPEVLPYVKGFDRVSTQHPAQVLTQRPLAPSIMDVPLPMRWQKEGSAATGSMTDAASDGSTEMNASGGEGSELPPQSKCYFDYIHGRALGDLNEIVEGRPAASDTYAQQTYHGVFQ